MSQVTSAEVPSGSGLSVRQAINAVLAALMSSNSGSAGPANPVPFQLWGDTAIGDIKIRDASNTVWVLLSDMIGALVHGRAQSFSSGQKTQLLENLGLGTALLAGQALGIAAFGAFGEGFHIDVYTKQGQVWRLVVSSTSKAASGNADIYVSYGATWLSVPTPIVSNGDAAVPSLMLSTFGQSASGFSITARNPDGQPYLGTYRVNYITFGRIG